MGKINVPFNCNLLNHVTLLSNIIGNLVGTTLALGGDAADNQLVVSEIAPNQIQVTGLSGTTINGGFAGVRIEPD